MRNRIFALFCALCVVMALSPPTLIVEAQSAACGIPNAAFCETWDTPVLPDGSRGGELDSTVWGASRILGAIVLSSHLYDSASPSTMNDCGSNYTAQPGLTDIIVCNGQMRESTYDEHGVTSLAVYPKQPFDFAGRTGLVTFDVSNDTSGSHGTWPEFWITDQPIPAPFTHSNPCDLCSAPRNGFGLDLSGALAPGNGLGGDCVTDNTFRWTVSGLKIFRNYVEQEINLFASPDFHQMGCVHSPAGPNGPLNHVEVHVAQNEIDVWATDPGQTTLHHLAKMTNVNLTFSRGLIWLEDSHYNAEKAADKTFDPNNPTPNLANHTFTWDNVGFDGPKTYRDVSLDVPDALIPTTVNTDAPGVTGKLINLGWGTTPTTPVSLLTVADLTQAQIDTARLANRGVLLMFNMGDANDGLGLQSINYSVDGHAHPAFTLPFSTIGKSYHSIALPVDFNDLVPGAQQLSISANRPMMVANVNVVLLAAMPVPGASTPTPTPVPPTPVPTTPTVPPATALPATATAVAATATVAAATATAVAATATSVSATATVAAATATAVAATATAVAPTTTPAATCEFRITVRVNGIEGEEGIYQPCST